MSKLISKRSSTSVPAEKKDFIEIRFHGRGGQGAKTAAQMLAEAALDEGKQIQAFPEYGPERGGAPVKAFVRMSDKPIRTFQPVVNPDYLVVVDPTLLSMPELLEGVTKDTVIVTNSKKKPVLKGFKGKLYYIDATDIALSTLKENRTNMAMLGALLSVSNLVDRNTLISKVRNHFINKIGKDKTEKNIEMIKKAYSEVKLA
ncbi:MAG: pyruvate synthase [Nitrospiraceae bacterium]|nr:pyruvate synthase [Nitrospiraceae bacterium]